MPAVAQPLAIAEGTKAVGGSIFIAPETHETVEKLLESGEVWAGEGFRGEL